MFYKEGLTREDGVCNVPWGDNYLQVYFFAILVLCVY